MNVQVTDCPQNLQESISKWQERLPNSKIIAIRKIESTPYKDKTIVDTAYKAYLQFAYEFLILSVAVTTGPSMQMERDVNINWLNGGDIMTIFDNADYVKDDLKLRLRRAKENFPGH